MRFRILPAVLTLAFFSVPAFADEPSALKVFQQRIVPILNAKNPSSCAECHLSGVDLKDYIRADQVQTFAALRDGGLIDVKQPDQSKLLTFIQRHSDRTSPVTKKVRDQELEAFRAWIHAAVQDPQLAAAKTSDHAIGAQLPDEVIRHMRRDRVLASFVDNVWSEVGRCAACHSPDRNRKQVEKFGEQVSWIKLGDPQATLDYMREAELLDVEQPERSLLLLKPTNLVEHGGGVKLMVGDRTYKQFRAFLDDYAASVNGRYKSTSELPAASNEISQVSEIWFKLEGVPSQYDKLLLRVDLFRRNDTGEWSTERWATGDRAVAGERSLWQQHLTVVAPRGSARASELRKNPRLPPGTYQARIYVDRDRRLERDPSGDLAESDLVATIQVETRWPAGYGQMTVSRFP
jgi:hypothetical protein